MAFDFQNLEREVLKGLDCLRRLSCYLSHSGGLCGAWFRGFSCGLRPRSLRARDRVGGGEADGVGWIEGSWRASEWRWR